MSQDALKRLEAWLGHPLRHVTFIAKSENCCSVSLVGENLKEVSAVAKTLPAAIHAALDRAEEAV